MLPTKDRLYINLDNYDRKSTRVHIESFGYKCYIGDDLIDGLWNKCPYIYLDYNEADRYYRYTFGFALVGPWIEYIPN